MEEIKTIIADPRVVSAVISALVALVIGVFTIWKIRKEMKHADYRFDEEITAKHFELRVEPYSKFMESLRSISSLEIRDISEDEKVQRVSEILNVSQNHIYGLVGVLSSHETRETIIKFRSTCINFIDGEVEFSEVTSAAWKVHQMLRYDLGLLQPGLRNAIHRIRRSDIPNSVAEIERFLTKMEHNEWKYRGHGRINAGS